MRFPFLAVLVVAALAAAATLPSALAQSGQGNSDGAPGQGRGPGTTPTSPTPIPIGSFHVDTATGAATGEFVSLQYGPNGIEDFVADGTPLFDLTLASGTSPIEDVDIQGSRLKVESDSFHLVVHDNPSAVTRIDADSPVVLTFVDGATIVEDRKGRQFSFQIGDLSGKIRGDALTLNGTRLTGEGELLLLLESMRASMDNNRPQIVDAIGKGHVGVEASFNQLDGDLEAEVVSYGNVTMTTLKAEQGNLTVLVDGHGFDGRVLVLNVDARVVGASKEGDLSILFDNETIQRADDLADVLDPDNDGVKAEYYIVFDPLTETFQLIVSLPHYSVHTLSVTTLAFLPPPSVVFGIVAGVALLVPAGFMLFGRRRD